MSLGRSDVHERVEALDRAADEHPELRGFIDLYKAILSIQQQIEESPTKGTTVDWSDQLIIDGLQQRALDSGRPVANFLDQAIFDRDAFLRICEEMTSMLIEREPKEVGLSRFLEEMRNGRINHLELVGAFLRDDTDSFKRQEEKFGIGSGLLLFITSTSMQPCLREIARRVSPSFLEMWWETICPVCGRKPILARLKSRKRYLTCTLCGAEYLSDLFICVNCGNRDPYSLKFLAPEGQPELRVDFCEKCKHYVKVIDEDKLKAPIPRGLEDLLTLSLDRMAKEAGLERSDVR